MRQGDASIVHTIAQLKGRRLRMARALTGFSRQELFEKIGIATSTIDTWESGRVELSQKSAERVCIALKKVGVACSSEWLLSGDGVPPRIMDDLEKTMQSVDRINGRSAGSVAVMNREILVTRKKSIALDSVLQKEIEFFMKLHENAICHVVDKDFLNARYKAGDCVAGVVDRAIQALIGKVVIAVLSNKKTILCKILSMHENGYCSVFMGADCMNERIQIISAAEVIWHRMLGSVN